MELCSYIGQYVIEWISIILYIQWHDKKNICMWIHNHKRQSKRGILTIQHTINYYNRPTANQEPANYTLKVYVICSFQ